ncbi:MAG TPA: 4-aminobutyrate--2-oxoglutarate transaminase [Desulfobacteraceae bacterium]|nr:4-aminobutyrate--2-oxoglutarate transaminase [Deltaproteobacteria bacterium]RLB98024.1 MAG: 4-aminobutyrate--2-oxoglutarate transaminase [Deltaproteobacteria bacterium]HDI58981.1 4-aminobutyrate--2-oxoglutarate transaminase [Desulfobacteraceae bacterium]
MTTPQNNNETLQERRSTVLSAGLASATAVHVASARGAIVRDVDGREFIDFGGGIGVMNIGHCHPKVVAAIRDQAEKFHHTCFMVNPYEVGIKLAEKLCRVTPGDFPKKALFLNSGAEAVENAVKIARYYTKRPAVIVFENAYHGRTLLTMTMTSKVKPYKFGFGPFAPEVYRMPFGDVVGPEKLKDFFLKHVNPEAVACVVAEPVQGEGGFIAPPEGYFQQLAGICRENGILFVADEIQSGMGRTGKMFAIEHWDVAPDLMTVAKSLGAGMPISAVVGRQEIMDAVHPFGLGGTYSGNPVASAAALAVLEVFEEEDMLGKAVALGEKLGRRFEAFRRQYPIVGEVRGLGAMRGLALFKGKDRQPAADEAKKLAAFCLERGLIILVCGTYSNVVRVLVPFVIEDEQLEKGLSILEAGLAEVSK